MKLNYPMASKYPNLKRLSLLIGRINEGDFPSKEQLISYIEDVLETVSIRTLERDLVDLKNNFFINVVAKHNGIAIEESPEAVNEFYLLLNAYNRAEIIEKSIQQPKDVLKSIQFESNTELKGISQIFCLLQAIEKRQKIKFLHQKFNADKSKKYSFLPYFLKEYQNRWYVVGKINHQNNVQVFGIDRMSSIEIHSEVFTRTNEDDVLSYFTHQIGIISGDDIEQIILSFTPYQANYLKTYPWHSSQSIVLENEHEVQFSFKIRINFELKQRILQHGASVKVISPVSLANEIKNTLQEILNRYTDTSS